MWPQLLRASALAGAAAALGAGLISAASGPLAATLPAAEAKTAKAKTAKAVGRLGAGKAGKRSSPNQAKKLKKAKSAANLPILGPVEPPDALPSVKVPPIPPLAATPAPPARTAPAQELAEPAQESAPSSAPAPRRRAASRDRAAAPRSRAPDRDTAARRKAVTRTAPAKRSPSTATESRPSPRARSGGEESPAGARDGDSGVTRTVRDIVEVLPESAKVALAALAALSMLLGAGSLFTALRARRLKRQRSELLRDVGLLQRTLLPPVPDTVGGLRASVAYRPADGPGAGGDFYDALELPDGRAAFIMGDVCGHGHSAIARTAFLRYTLRAYLEAGLEPRVALQVAGRVIGGQLGGDLATVMLVLHDPETGSLTYASAGHPAPIVVGPSSFQPVLAASSPPLGVGLPTGLRQTTVPLAPGSVACMYTDGLTEARTNDGILGRGRLGDILAGLGRDATAQRLLKSVADEARVLSDDMATCLLTPTGGVTAGGFRVEQLELSAAELDTGLGRRFLLACGVEEKEADCALEKAHQTAHGFGGVVLQVVFGNRVTVDPLPRNLQSIEAASRSTVAA